MIDTESPERTRNFSKPIFYFSNSSVISFELCILHSYYFNMKPTVLFFFSFLAALKEFEA